MANCPGSLILHADGTIAGCSEDDEPDGRPVPGIPASDRVAADEQVGIAWSATFGTHAPREAVSGTINPKLGA